MISREPITYVKAPDYMVKHEVTNDGIYSDRYFNNITMFYGVPGANAGNKNGMYKHGRWGKYNKPPKTSCKKCGSKTNLVYHHKNHDETDNRKSNIVVWCKKCHDQHHERGNNFHGKKSKNASKKRVKNGKAYR